MNKRVVNQLNVMCYLVFTVMVNYRPEGGVTTGEVSETAAPIFCL